MNTLQSVSIIRNRGQLTIPDEIRKAIKWIVPLSAVSITVKNADEITIRPHTHEKNIDWDAVWNAIKLARLQKGTTGSLSEFIAEDRYNH